MTTIRVPRVIWALGDPEQATSSGVTVTTRPIYYCQNGASEAIRVGSISPDYAEVLMTPVTERHEDASGAQGQGLRARGSKTTRR